MHTTQNTLSLYVHITLINTIKGMSTCYGIMAISGQETFCHSPNLHYPEVKFSRQYVISIYMQNLSTRHQPSPETVTPTKQSYWYSLQLRNEDNCQAKPQGWLVWLCEGLDLTAGLRSQTLEDNDQIKGNVTWGLWSGERDGPGRRHRRAPGSSARASPCRLLLKGLLSFYGCSLIRTKQESAV